MFYRHDDNSSIAPYVFMVVAAVALIAYEMITKVGT